MKKSDGFTLIELLAVILILSIIALIAVPIVTNIINKSEESAALSSASLYLDAVSNSVLLSKVEGKKVKDGKYKIMENGNICSGNIIDKSCNGGLLKVEMSGDVPDYGEITIMDDSVKKAILTIGEETIVKTLKGKLVYYTSVDYEIGNEVKFDPGDGQRTWYVIDQDENTVTLLLNENLLNPNTIDGTVEWYSSDDNNAGPITALTTLNSLTSNWNNVSPIES